MKQKHRKTGIKNGSLIKNPLFFALAVLIGITAAVMITRNRKGSSSPDDILIAKNTVTDKVQYYPVKVGKINLEVMAVKAGDGTIRTAFNTCQVCYGSPRAYYKQEGDVVVCQNCGNHFSMDMIEVQRGGCNPVPILPDEKIDNGDTIIIPGSFIAENKDLFTANWKSQ